MSRDPTPPPLYVPPTIPSADPFKPGVPALNHIGMYYSYPIFKILEFTTSYLRKWLNSHLLIVTLTLNPRIRETNPFYWGGRHRQIWGGKERKAKFISRAIPHKYISRVYALYIQKEQQPGQLTRAPKRHASYAPLRSIARPIHSATAPQPRSLKTSPPRSPSPHSPPASHFRPSPAHYSAPSSDSQPHNHTAS